MKKIMSNPLKNNYGFNYFIFILTILLSNIVLSQKDCNYYEITSDQSFSVDKYNIDSILYNFISSKVDLIEIKYLVMSNNNIEEISLFTDSLGHGTLITKTGKYNIENFYINIDTNQHVQYFDFICTNIRKECCSEKMFVKYNGRLIYVFNSINGTFKEAIPCDNSKFIFVESFFNFIDQNETIQIKSKRKLFKN